MPGHTDDKPRLARLLSALLSALVIAASLVATGPVTPAAGAPPSPPGTDGEGGTAALREQLEAASRGFLDARNDLAKSQRRQQQLAVELKQLEADLAAQTAVVGEMAATAYRGGRLRATTALLDADSPEGFLDRVATLDAVAANQSQKVKALVEARQRVQRAQLAIAEEIRQQQRQVKIMAARKEQAERALATAIAEAGRPSRGPSARAPRRGGGGPSRARPAPRNRDGSLPREGCNRNDPTTSGCVTPRLLHAYNQARAAGFRRHTSCFRNGSFGEHPKGRACDFAAQRGGFGGTATGGDRRYGNNLANYFVRNADRLGVLYVIWFREIWLPSSGWRTYRRGGGDPSSAHTNHVHLSVY